MIIVRDDPNKNVWEVFSHSTIARGEFLGEIQCNLLFDQFQLFCNKIKSSVCPSVSSEDRQTDR